jgi:hypothetical protein
MARTITLSCRDWEMGRIFHTPHFQFDLDLLKACQGLATLPLAFDLVETYGIWDTDESRDTWSYENLSSVKRYVFRLKDSYLVHFHEKRNRWEVYQKGERYMTLENFITLEVLKNDN